MLLKHSIEFKEKLSVLFELEIDEDFTVSEVVSIHVSKGHFDKNSLDISELVLCLFSESLDAYLDRTDWKQEIQNSKL